MLSIKGKAGIFCRGSDLPCQTAPKSLEWLRVLPPLHRCLFLEYLLQLVPHINDVQLNPAGLPQKRSQEPLGPRCGMFCAGEGEEQLQRFRRSLSAACDSHHMARGPISLQLGPKRINVAARGPGLAGFGKSQERVWIVA